MHSNMISVEGFVADAETGTALAELRVEIWPTGREASEPWAVASSDEHGGFTFALPVEHSPDLDDDALVEVELRVIDRGRVQVRQVRALRPFERSEVVVIEVPSPVAMPPRGLELEAELDTPSEAGSLSEYAAVQELVGAEIETVDELEDEAIDELARGVGVDAERVALLYRAQQLEAQTGLPGALFYALGRGRLPIEPHELVDLPVAELRVTIEEAVADGTVGADLLEDLDAVLEQLSLRGIDTLLEGGASLLGGGLATILASADLPTETMRHVLRRYQRRSGGVAELWESLAHGDAEHEALDPSVGNELRLAVELGGLVGPDAPLLRRLHALRREGKWAELEDLASFDFDDWCELVALDDDPSTHDDEGLEDDEDVEERAEAILERLEEAFPSVFIRRELVETEALGTGARSLLERAPRHDLVLGSIRRLAAADASLLEGFDEAEAEAAIEEIEAVERVSRVTHYPEEVALLVGTGMRSAHEIAATPRRHFVAAYGEALGGPAQASRVHAQAQHSAAATMLAMVGAQQAQQQAPFVLGGGSDPARQAQDRALKEIPDARALFGSIGLCSCEHCGSVYSPAAYLVDLLRYLDIRDPERLRELEGTLAKRGFKPAQLEQLFGHRPLDVLLARRPDLADIPLTCQNTLTPLPYIDLVNELLEARVTGKSGAHDTGKTPADVLKAVPQRKDREAYDKLRVAVHPTSMPYHEPLAVARAYLAHLGVPRLHLMKTLARGQVDREAVLAESLAMSPEELALVARPPEQPWLHLGFAASHHEETRYLDVLASAPRWLEATDTTFEELIAIASTRFINGDDGLKLASPAPDCDPEKVRITGLDEARVSKMLRLIRLRRRLGWSFIDLDRALVAIGAVDLDTTVLEKLVEARELTKALDRPIGELLGLWAPLDAVGRDNQFERLLQTRAVAWRTQDADIFKLRPDRMELVTTGDSLDPVAPALLAAFRITSQELATAHQIHARRGTILRLDLAGISAVYRVATLARALRLRIDELDALLRLVPPQADPFRPGDPAATRRFVEIVRLVQSTEFTPATLVHLFRPTADAPRDPSPTTAQVGVALEGIRKGLVDAFTETTRPTDLTADALRSKLALLLDAPLVEPVMEALDPRTKASATQRRELFDHHLARIFPDATAAAARVLSAGPATPPAPSPTEAVVTPASAAPPTSTSASTPPASTPAAAALESRWRDIIDFVLEHLLPHLRARQMRSVVVQGLADALGTSNKSMAHLVESVLRSRRRPGRAILDDFYAMLGTGLTAAYFAGPELVGAPVSTRVEEKIELSPRSTAGLPSGGFGVRWSGRLLATSKAPHTFFATTSGAVKVTLEISGREQVVLERASASGRGEEHASRPVELEVGKLYPITIEYRHTAGAASFSLQLGTNPNAKQAIPTPQLFPADGLPSLEPAAASYRRVHKAARLVTGFAMTDAQLRWLTGEPRYLDLDALALEPGAGDATAVASFQRWHQLAKLYALRKQLPRAELDLFDVLSAADLQEAVTRLVTASGWSRPVVEALVGPTGLALRPDDLRLPVEPSEEPGVLRIARAIDVQRRIGVAVPTLMSWAGQAPDADVAASIVQAVKSRYDEKRWLEVAQSLNDPLRSERRDALVSYLLPRMRAQGVRRRSQLFEYFLIDVDMNPCMYTSRIKQAISAVQTFFQRVLMNLEAQVQPRMVDERDWKWLRSYRVWEANRKIFLYPENWIEPELRDDKSPFFKELERSILQQEITKENVESAFVDYLQHLDEVARLDVRAVWFEPRSGAPVQRGPKHVEGPPRTTWDDGTYHIFARTFNEPHVWFYRRLERGRSWTAWEKIDADIEGDHLVPLVFQRRMHLFWTVFRKVAKKAQPKKGEPPSSVGEDWEVSLAYSVYDRGKWRRKQISTRGVLDEMRITFLDDILYQTKIAGQRTEGSAWLPQSNYTLRARVDDDGGNLRIFLYRRAVDDVRLRRLLYSSPSPEVALSSASVELVARFELDGCNGSLEPVPQSGVATISAGPQALRRAERRKTVAARLGRGRRAPSKMSVPQPSPPPRTFIVERGGNLPAPAGYRVDATGFSPERSHGSLLAMPGPSGALASVLGGPRGGHRGVRVLPVTDPSGQSSPGLFPFFFQDGQRSFFVRPITVLRGPRIVPVLVARPLTGPRAMPGVARPGRRKPLGLLAQVRASRASSKPGKRAARRGRGPSRSRPESEAQEQDPPPILGDPPPLAEGFEELDQWEDEEEAAWHPDEARERRGPRRRRQRPRPARPATPPAGRAPSPAAAPRPRAGAPAPSPTPRTPRFRLQLEPARYEQQLRFTSFEHPATCRLIRTLLGGGIDKLLDLHTTRPRRNESDADLRWIFDRWVRQGPSYFQQSYRPGPLTDTTSLPDLHIDFDPSHPYAQYNWELFFHAPLQIATRLAKDGRHEEAQRWFHFIFDPTADVSSPAPQRYWRFAPFHENSSYESAKELMALLSYSSAQPDPKLLERQRKVTEQVTAWLEKPFSPHVIARLRMVAYQKATLMKYLDNLIEWGDKLFRRDTMESIQEATQLYILAGNILGPRPERIPPMVETEPVTFRQVRDRVDVFSNWVVRFESSQVRRPFRIHAEADVGAATSVLGMATQYFCIPNNPKMDQMWDTVADRLFKIRNCANIRGVVRQLALFEPPIDPALLVKAAAAGVDLGSVVANLNAPPPNHRFRAQLARAVRMAEELRRFGAAALAVLEKKDAEGLCALRASNERQLVEAMREIQRTKIKQVELQQAYLALGVQAIDQQIAVIDHFLATPISPQQVTAQQSRTEAKVVGTVIEGINLAAKVVRAIPEFQIGAAGGFSSPFTTAQIGGHMAADISLAVAQSLVAVATIHTNQAEQAMVQAEIEEAKRLATAQKQQLELDKQQTQNKIAEIDLQLEICNAELRRDDASVDAAKMVETYLRDKYTNAELYGWMLGEVSTVYFQAYRFAFDTAKLAERALHFEQGDSSSQLIQFSYWDSLRKGLLAGERLLVDLRRMEAAYAESDRRALEITRHVSLREDAPAELQQLLGAGQCALEVTEALLDGDFPGHYFRRIKTVTISIVGSLPLHANVNCTLTLLGNRIRSNPSATGSYPQAEDGDDPRFIVDIVPVQAIATSRPQADPGLFELRFDDDRYLPFEGAGAISSWRLELRQADNAIDLGKLRDVVVSISYTARSGGTALEAAARASRERGLARGSLLPPPRHAISVRHDLPAEWKRLAEATPGQDVELALPLGELSGRYRDRSVRLERVVTYAHARSQVNDDSLRIKLDPPKGSGSSLAGWSRPWPRARVVRAAAELGAAQGAWKLTIGASGGRVPELFEDVVLIFDLSVRAS